MMNTPLVSVVVLTYNSGTYIVETLESVKDQDYRNIELVVCDDGSKDQTCSIVESWIEKNKNCFNGAYLIKSFKNKGTCCNYNQGIFNSHGTYIKTLDGDDLLNTCHSISKYVEFVLRKQCDICIADVQLFCTDNIDLSKYIRSYEYYFNCICEPLNKQKERIIKEMSLPDPALFFHRKVFYLVDGFDEKYKLQEEWPFYMKVLDNNIQIMGLDEKLVRYRITNSSASHDQSKRSQTKKMFVKDNLDFFFNVRIKRLFKARDYKLLIRQFLIYSRDYIYQCL